MYRRKLNKRKSKRMFTRGAMRIKKRNYNRSPMRGGYRL